MTPRKKKSAPAPAERVLILRSCKADGSPESEKANGFKYPLVEGVEVECPDWNPAKECGGGLHGLLWGQGAQKLMCWDMDAWWQVFSCDPADVVDLGDKVKFKKGVQVFMRQHLSPGFALAHAYLIANDTRKVDKASSGTSTSEAKGENTVAMVAGLNGRARCGKGGCIALAYWDEKAKRVRAVCGDEGDGIKADTWYRVESGKLVECAS